MKIKTDGGYINPVLASVNQDVRSAVVVNCSKVVSIETKYKERDAADEKNLLDKIRARADHLWNAFD